MARSARAMFIVRQSIPAGERVLDLGCGAGYTTALMTRHYETHGIDISHEHLQMARRRAPAAYLQCATAAQIPYPDAHFAAVVTLDVLEHVDQEGGMIAEIARVLRPGGLLVLSVPNTGLFRWLDSLNIYAWLTSENPLGPPGIPVEQFMFHRHYSVPVLQRLLGDRFRMSYVHYSGFGVAELIHLAVLLYTKRLLRSRQRYIKLASAYHRAYLWEDRFQRDASGYHVMIAARRATQHVQSAQLEADKLVSPTGLRGR